MREAHHKSAIVPAKGEVRAPHPRGNGRATRPRFLRAFANARSARPRFSSRRISEMTRTLI